MTNITTKKIFPPALPLKKLIGPSFLILALGLGSGEVILWPYLVSNFGLGIAWGAVLGITFQFFINMEIERYALVRGESVFVGLRRLYTWAPIWFIVSTFLGFGLPGIAAASAQIIASVFGWPEGSFKWLAIALLILIGLILSIGKTVYAMMEHLTQAIIMLGVPLILLIALYLVRSEHLVALGWGILGQGHNYNWLPSGMGLVTFLAAFAYSGAGGNLNLTQSIFVKEKGYGMGKYAQKMSGLFHRASDSGVKSVKLSGESFEATAENMVNFKVWWQRVNIEHAIVFWAIGLFTILLLMTLSYATVFGLSGNAKDIDFVLNEGRVVGANLLPWIGSLFLFVLGVMLFQTQLGVLDSTSRIMSENIALFEMDKAGEVKADLSRIYYAFLWLQITFGIMLFLFDHYNPKTLLIIGAVINAVAMFVHTGMMYRLNNTSLPVACRPAKWRKAVVIIIFLFFGVFSAITLYSQANIYIKDIFLVK